MVGHVNISCILILESFKIGQNTDNIQPDFTTGSKEMSLIARTDLSTFGKANIKKIYVIAASIF